MTQILFLVGDIGGGKTTLAKYLALLARQQVKDYRIVTNTEMGIGWKVDDINRFLGMKIIQEDKRPLMAVVDEAALAGWESRGSGSYSSAIESRLITMARKINVEPLIIVTQLASMVEKRAQWMSTYTILCEAFFDEKNVGNVPDFFDYTVYDTHMAEVNQFSISAYDAKRYIWPGMDTNDIPLKETFALQLRRYYSIGYAKGDYDNEEFHEEVKQFEQVMVSSRW